MEQLYSDINSIMEKYGFRSSPRLEEKDRILRFIQLYARMKGLELNSEESDAIVSLLLLRYTSKSKPVSESTHPMKLRRTR